MKIEIQGYEGKIKHTNQEDFKLDFDSKITFVFHTDIFIYIINDTLRTHQVTKKQNKIILIFT